ncbi:MAG: 2,3-bisphosphoglycerate-independent phosphoglycerate mutase [Vicinamibacterales bacterium]
MPRRKPPVALVVLDGWGISLERDHNAVMLGSTPNYDELLDRFPHGSLVTSGEAVGLPPGQMGNSEVGHMNLGAGRVVYQDLTRIDHTIRNGDFFKNDALCDAISHCIEGRHNLHLVGLVSDGGVHSHLRHLLALIELTQQHRVPNLFVHAITDGRDSSPTGASDYLPSVESSLHAAGTGRIASVCGRYYAMDRDKRWERTQKAYDALVRGKGRQATNVERLVRNSHKEGVTDEFIEPTAIVNENGQPVGPLRDGDAVIFFNYRADRARQLVAALAFDNQRFSEFERGDRSRINVTTLTEYEATYQLPVAFSPATFTGNVAEVLARNQLTNLRLAETEKYAHVTYFFNSGEETPYAGEERILVPSPKVPTYDLAPDMSAKSITDQFVNDINKQQHDVIICNFANADMVGHTGKLDATVQAVSTLDQCLERIVKAVTSVDGTLLITADHGNAEQLWDTQRQGPHTAHTRNPVPIVLVNNSVGSRNLKLRDGSLRDVAPTLLHVAGVETPSEMTGKDLRPWVDDV